MHTEYIKFLLYVERAFAQVTPAAQLQARTDCIRPQVSWSGYPGIMLEMSLVRGRKPTSFVAQSAFTLFSAPVRAPFLDLSDRELAWDNARNVVLPGVTVQERSSAILTPEEEQMLQGARLVEGGVRRRGKSTSDPVVPTNVLELKPHMLSQVKLQMRARTCPLDLGAMARCRTGGAHTHCDANDNYMCSNNLAGSTIPLLPPSGRLLSMTQHYSGKGDVLAISKGFADQHCGKFPHASLPAVAHPRVDGTPHVVKNGYVAAAYRITTNARVSSRQEVRAYAFEVHVSSRSSRAIVGLVLSAGLLENRAGYGSTFCTNRSHCGVVGRGAEGTRARVDTPIAHDEQPGTCIRGVRSTLPDNIVQVHCVRGAAVRTARYVHHMCVVSHHLSAPVCDVLGARSRNSTASGTRKEEFQMYADVREQMDLDGNNASEAGDGVNA